MLRKGLAVAVILLFIGVAFAPSINSSIIEDELVEFDVEFCGLGKKYTVQLTQQEADEVELLFEEIHEKLQTKQSRENTKEIFYDAIANLATYGLFGNYEIPQIKQLITGKNHYTFSLPNLIDYFNNNLNTDSNFFCYVAGNTTNTYFVNPMIRRNFVRLMNWDKTLIVRLINWAENNGYGDLLNILKDLETVMIDWIAWRAIVFGMLRTNLVPISIRNCVGIGDNETKPAVGWIDTVGLNGNKSWDGNIIGDIPQIFISPQVFYFGFVGFSGIKISRAHYEDDWDNIFSHYYLGFALLAKNKEM